MIYFAYSAETASANIALALREILGLEEIETFHGLACFGRDEIRMFDVGCHIINAEFLSDFIDAPIIFLSRHSSSLGVSAFTVHPEGNWSVEASFGGKPKMLSVASPVGMLRTLKSIKSLNDTELNVTYEVTHHGPLTNSPSFFVELGGNEETIGSASHAKLLASAIARSIETDADAEYDKVAVGFGGMHYPKKFTLLAMDGKYAFSHMMPKHHIGKIDMIVQAFARSDLPAEIAVIEWKGIKGADREVIIRELARLGIDYAKV
jgi:D-aminoacyl-tRNA deacylase